MKERKIRIHHTPHTTSFLLVTAVKVTQTDRNLNQDNFLKGKKLFLEFAIIKVLGYCEQKYFYLFKTEIKSVNIYTHTQ